MKNRRVLSTLIVAAFIAVAVFSFFSVFTIKKINVVFSASENVGWTDEASESLNTFVGANLLFFNCADAEKILSDNTYAEVTKIEKKYPNVIEVHISERQEIYTVSFDGKEYVADMDGFILAEKTASDDADKLIELTTAGDLAITEIRIGGYIVCNDGATLKTAFSLAKSVRLTDCIKKMTVSANSEQSDAEFSTYTEVKIYIPKIAEQGELKTVSAFEFYNTEKSDFIKSSNEIRADLLTDGTVRTVWVSRP